jgi:hypothetical protein
MARSFKRARERRIERERRRAALLARRGARLAGATLSTTVLLAAGAQAATLTVSTTGDDAAGGTCPADSCTTLRDAIGVANGAGGATTIVFASGVHGAINLSHGALEVTDANGLTISGPGAATLSVSAGGASRVLTIDGNDTDSASVTISGLTLTDGNAGSNSGGAIETVSSGSSYDDAIPLTLINDVVSGSTTTAGSSAKGGGGIYAQGDLTLTGTTVTGNTAPAGDGGAIDLSKYKELSSPSILIVTGSTISGNSALDGGGTWSEGPAIISGSQITSNHAVEVSTDGGLGGGIFAPEGLVLTNSTVSGNTSTVDGGGILLASYKYGGSISGSTISNNSSASGGGLLIADETPKYAPVTVNGSTISGNQASRGAGVYVGEIEANSVTIQTSTLTGNQGGANSFGGGLEIAGRVYGPFELLDSTISGNTATTGAGVDLGGDPATNTYRLIGSRDYNGHKGSIAFGNSTIAANTASGHGGGIYMGDYSAGSPATKQNGTAAITSTIVAGNSPEDLARVTGSTSPQAFSGMFSLIQSPGSTPLTGTSLITGKSPALGALGHNGGPTETMLPSGTSPVIDQGHAPNSLTEDQRGLARVVGIPGMPRPPGGDSADIGAAELPASAVPPVFSVTVGGAPLGHSPAPLLAGGSTPVKCAVRVGTIGSCTIEVRAGGKLLADGESNSSSPFSTTLALPTAAGLSKLKHFPLGRTAPATVVGGASGELSLTGNVRLLAGPSITLKSKRSATLSKKVLGELKQAAKLLSGAKSIKVTAYASSGKDVGSLTNAEAKAAAKALSKDGFKGKLKSAGTSKGSRNQLVLKFKL